MRSSVLLTFCGMLTNRATGRLNIAQSMQIVFFLSDEKTFDKYAVPYLSVRPRAARIGFDFTSDFRDF